ncbi:TRAP transporter small permease subunit [Gracilibacillus salitolerans]|uniref:TRAP transporter small permease subunit n=1 Tax=Gracilibacillus salitolerans TaxID=2663022 RepID=A0A5Q2TPV0_9BACI|nr:TRAP transporter small permease [Gracilibacillus salitolerans]QGH36162.1 TRAP transporter small permease subunit [Gracilibacillus salitolerans]
MKALKKVKQLIDQFLLVLSVTLIGIIVLTILFQIFTRTFFNFTPAWSEELARLLFVWISFLGIAYGFKEKLHIAVGVFVKKFNEKIKRLIDNIAKVLIIILGVILIYFGTEFMLLMNYSTMAGLGISTSFLYAAIPVAGIFITANGIELLFIKGLHQEYDDGAKG